MIPAKAIGVTETALSSSLALVETNLRNLLQQKQEKKKGEDDGQVIP